MSSPPCSSSGVSASDIKDTLLVHVASQTPSRAVFVSGTCPGPRLAAHRGGGCSISGARCHAARCNVKTSRPVLRNLTDLLAREAVEPSVCKRGALTLCDTCARPNYRSHELPGPCDRHHARYHARVACDAWGHGRVRNFDVHLWRHGSRQGLRFSVRVPRGRLRDVHVRRPRPAMVLHHQRRLGQLRRLRQQSHADAAGT